MDSWSARRDVVLNRAIWVLIAILVGVGLVTAVRASFTEFRPEIVVETCSFVTALLLLVAEQRASRQAARRTAIRHATGELLSNAKALCHGCLMTKRGDLEAQIKDLQCGLRFYYPTLASEAVKSALGGGALDGHRDAKLVKQLSEWLIGAELCNARFTMAELLLFFLPATPEAMQERFQLHVSIAAGPAAKQRAALQAAAQSLDKFVAEGSLPRESSEHLDAMTSVFANFPEAETIADDAMELLAHSA